MRIKDYFVDKNFLCLLIFVPGFLVPSLASWVLGSQNPGSWVLGSGFLGSQVLGPRDYAYDCAKIEDFKIYFEEMHCNMRKRFESLFR